MTVYDPALVKKPTQAWNGMTLCLCTDSGETLISFVTGEGIIFRSWIYTVHISSTFYANVTCTLILWELTRKGRIQTQTDSQTDSMSTLAIWATFKGVHGWATGFNLGDEQGWNSIGTGILCGAFVWEEFDCRWDGSYSSHAVRLPSRRSQIKAESFLRFSTGNEILNDHSPEVDPDNDRDGQSLWGCPDVVLVCYWLTQLDFGLLRHSRCGSDWASRWNPTACNGHDQQATKLIVGFSAGMSTASLNPCKDSDVWQVLGLNPTNLYPVDWVLEADSECLNKCWKHGIHLWPHEFAAGEANWMCAWSYRLADWGSVEDLGIGMFTLYLQIPPCQFLSHRICDNMNIWNWNTGAAGGLWSECIGLVHLFFTARKEWRQAPLGASDGVGSLKFSGKPDGWCAGLHNLGNTCFMNAGLPRVALVRLQKVLVWTMRKRIVNSTSKKRSKNKCRSGLKRSFPYTYSEVLSWESK